MKLVTVAEMRAIEQEANAKGLSYAQMMEHAGYGLATEISKLPFPQNEIPHVLGLVGPGNNGGDTLVALAHLATKGWKTTAYLVKRKAQEDALIERLKQAGGEIISLEHDLQHTSLKSLLEQTTILIDGILGTGIQFPLKPEIAAVMETVNQTISNLAWPPDVVAVDCPSGVDCDTGQAAPEVIPASVTVCMAAVKQGLLQLPAFELAGELRVVEIGLTDEITAWKNIRHAVADADMVRDMLPARPSDAHKGTFGTLLVIAGSVNYTGAALLAGKSAYRAGTGLVQMAVPGALHPILAGNFPEATWILLPTEKGVIAEHAAEVLMKNLDRATALLIGPGLGNEETTAKFLEALLNGTSGKKNVAPIGFVRRDAPPAPNETTVTLPPMVIDADGLRHVAKLKEWHKLLPAESILTPHPGEMAALTGLEKDQIQSARLETALKYAAEWGHIVVLKGAFTVIAAPQGQATVIPVATPALARAGTGDVLAGLIGGLRAQGVPPYESAIAGAWIHAQAGLMAAEAVGDEASVLAGDVMESIRLVLSGF
ncbi:MAG: bifunctional ADP-dependent NAD(P)H-hydrate dehydratase/NAD(P)H-hydrate epimerase [Anaerolineae bacterium]|nr:MAG: bifunctional ADP-dependent NAD(P)H-hydrate dehydratase/NAD(P)H-hydrate epimerase [Anaerolineae bacterium]